VSSPFAQTAGDDCCEASFHRKRNDYLPILPELENQGITYMPLCFNSYGRLHAEVVRWLDFSAKAAARRRGISNFRPILARVRRNIAVAVQRRLVNQVRACLPYSEDALESIFSELDNAALVS